MKSSNFYSPKLDELPDGVSVDAKSFSYKNQIIFYKNIKSLRIYSEIQKMTFNFVPMPTNVRSNLEIFDQRNNKIKIKLHFQRFGIKRKKKEIQF